jgi:lysine 2,3-aminomutase
VEHFRVPVRRGLKIMEQLRRRLSSLAIPTYVLDTPTAGKIPLSAAAIIRATKQRIVLRSPHGQLVEYPEPLER